MNKTKLVFWGIVTLTLLVVTFLMIDVVKIRGGQAGIHETWSEGVISKHLAPRTHMFIPGFMHKVHIYDISSRVFVMNDLSKADEEYGEGRSQDAYTVQTSEGQTVKVSCIYTWHQDPELLSEFHVKVNNYPEEKRIRPALKAHIKNNVTVLTAIEVYSGSGLVTVQQQIKEALKEDPELASVGIVTEDFIISGMELDADYVKEIEARQVAIQAERRAAQEEKAALAEAQKAKAVAQADYETKVVQAERDKQVGILKAEEEAQKEVLAAEADKKKQVLAAEANKESDELRAIGILARGKAEAEAKKLQLSAYAVDGAESFVQIEVSKNMASAFENVSGYLPQDMNISVLTENFLNGLGAVVGKPKLQPAAN